MATYYFNTSGNDANPGTFASPKKTIQEANSVISGMSPGDMLLFKAGQTWYLPAHWGTATYLNIAKNGVGDADGSRIIIGAYNTAARLTLADSFTRPIISGDADGDNGCDRPSNTEAGKYNALVSVTGDYVTIENLAITNSGAQGIGVKNNTYGKVLNCTTTKTQMSGIYFSLSTHASIIYNEVSYAAEARGCTGHRTWPTTPSDWPASLVVVNNSTEAYIAYNKVHHTCGEGIGVYKGSANSIVEYNHSYANSHPNIYISNTPNTIVRYNLAHGTTDSQFIGTGGGWKNAGGTIIAGPTPGIQLGVETATWTPAWSNHDSIVYGNLVAFQYGGLAITNNEPTFHGTGHKLYNNIVVDCYINMYISGGSSAGISSIWKNNAFIKYSVIPANYQGAKQVSINDGAGLTTGDYNFWTSDPDSDDADYASQGLHDLISASPLLNKTSGWNTIVAASPLRGTEFAPRYGSPIINSVVGIPGYTTLPISGSIWPLLVFVKNLAGTLNFGALQTESPPYTIGTFE